MAFFKVETEEDIKNLNFLERIYGILFKPSITIKNLMYQPKLVYPAIVKIVGIVFLYILRYPVYERHIRELLKMRLSQPDAGFTPQEIDLAIKLAPKSVITSTLINNTLSWIFIVLALYAVIKWVFRGKADVAQLFSITGYAYTPVLIYFLICFIASFFTGQLLVDMSPALLFPLLKGTTIYGFLRSIDPFMVWQFVIIAIGIKMSSGIKKSDVYWVTAFAFLVTVFVNIDYYKLLD
ncbi:Yip1 domain-containing protein [Thermoanaerobacter uzonensis DSM 18761]|uniref:Yip1 domain-containing protein n=1 Tax=Thermoanaerobacter uzonensis DSM 18761 TaxID=1123369 RepID=A0A1M4SYN5_9THEO|nr:YIP1 family protein [Thermoanaerobacter uzonensis]SHE37254.1 Yip1 domain-containing protein [Thermoanaerobacter uzonensis DSM 18761]